jgi:hypothetical protein
VENINPHNVPRIKPVQAVLLTIVLVLFWYLRATYWNVTNEQPFSDMADYLAISERFLCCGMLEHSPFWRSYLKPALPVFGAGVFSIVGEGNLLGWRIFQTGFLFISLLWFGRELLIATSNHWVTIGLYLTVAISKSSIFWSYKFATEGLGEALLYLVCAATLHLYRRGTSLVWSTTLGVVTMFALYNRPNIILIVPLILLAISCHSLPWPRFRQMLTYLPNMLGLAVGFALLAIPFAMRAQGLYGAALFSPTQGPYSFLWEFGAVTVVDQNGEKVTRTAQELQAEAPSKFENDYQAANYAKTFVNAWLAENWNDLYPRLIRNRFFSTIENRDIALSRVPRTKLFDSWHESILIDKTWAFFFIGAAGLIIMTFVYGGGLYVVAGSALLPWLFGLFFSSDPRLLEPSLPLVLFGNIALIIVCVRYLQRLSETDRPNVLGSVSK